MSYLLLFARSWGADAVQSPALHWHVWARSLAAVVLPLQQWSGGASASLQQLKQQDQHHGFQQQQQRLWHSQSWKQKQQLHQQLGQAQLGLSAQVQQAWQPHQPCRHQQLQQQGRVTTQATSIPSTHATTILCVRRGSEVVIIGDGQATQNDFIVKSNVRKVRRIGPNAVGGFAGVAVDGLTLLERLETKLEEHPGQLQRAAVELAKMWRQDKLLRELDATLVVADATTTLWLMGNGDVLEVAADGVTAIGSGADFAESAARALLQLQDDAQQQQDAVKQGQQSSSRSEQRAQLNSSNKSLTVQQQQEQEGQQQENAQAEQQQVPEEVTGFQISFAEGSTADAKKLPSVLVGHAANLSVFEVAKLAMKIAADCCVYTNDRFSWHHIKPDGIIESGSSVEASAGISAVAAKAH